MPAPSRPLRLGTRASPLALAQARLVRDALLTAHGWSEDRIELHPQTASGDKVLDRPLAEIGGKALWTKELDRALLSGSIDFAVHSMKDVETIRPAEIAIAAMLPRADVRDRIVGVPSIEALAPGARVGTSSPRRSAQLRHIRPDIGIVLFRGNVQTRLTRLEKEEAEATLLAAAGLDRLGLSELGNAVPVESLLPAPAQGAIGIECRAGDGEMRALLSAIDHADTHRCVLAERACLAALGATCHSPVGALAIPAAKGLSIELQLLAPDGVEQVRERRNLSDSDGGAITAFARELLAGAPESVAKSFAP